MILSSLHRKKGFAEVFKSLARYRSENNFIENQSKTFKLIASMLKLFIALSIINSLQNYFNSSIKLFSDLYLTLDTYSIKSFLSCINRNFEIQLEKIIITSSEIIFMFHVKYISLL